MSRLTEIRRFATDYRAAELITSALQDISSVKMHELRGQFEHNARFFSGIREVYGVVKAHAVESGVGAADTPGAAEKRDIYIGLTSNKRFYGTLNRDIVRALVRLAATADKSDFLMIGLTGAQYLEETAAPDRVARTAFDDDVPSSDELQNVLSLITEYRRVFVVYPKFINPLRQDVAMVDLTQTPTALVTPAMRADYIFEPEIPGMLRFFEAQVRRVLFERILLETELARSAARMVKMRNAKDRAGKLRTAYERRLRHEFATLADIALMETFIGFSAAKQSRTQ